MAFGMSGKIRLGLANKDGTPKFSRTDGGVVYKDASKIVSPTKRLDINKNKQNSK